MALSKEYMERVTQFATWAAGADGVALPEYQEAFARVRFLDPEIDMQFDAFMFGLSIGLSEAAEADAPVPVQSKITPLVWWRSLDIQRRAEILRPCIDSRAVENCKNKGWFNLSFELQNAIEESVKAGRPSITESPWH